MLILTGPTTTAMEDLRKVGLILDEEVKPNGKVDTKSSNDTLPAHGKKTPDEKGSTASAGEVTDRVNVPVRPDTNGPADPKASNDGPAKAEDEEQAGAPVSEQAPKPRFAPAWLRKQFEANEAAQAEAEQQEAVAARDTLVQRAFELVTAYHESEEQLGDEALTAVIEAYSMIVDAYDAQLHEANDALESVAKMMEDDDKDADDKDGAEKSDDKDKDDDKKSDKDDDKKDDKDGDDKKDDKKGKLPAFFGKQAPPFGKKAMESITPTLQRAQLLLSEGTAAKRPAGLDELVAGLKSLEESIAAPSAASTKVRDHAKLIEGYETLRDTAAELTNKIVNQIAEERGIAEGSTVELADNDPRTEFVQYFDSISESATNILAALAAKKFDDESALADLATMHADLERGIEAMKQTK